MGTGRGNRNAKAERTNLEEESRNHRARNSVLTCVGNDRNQNREAEAEVAAGEPKFCEDDQRVRMHMMSRTPDYFKLLKFYGIDDSDADEDENYSFDDVGNEEVYDHDQEEPGDEGDGNEELDEDECDDDYNEKSQECEGPSEGVTDTQTQAAYQVPKKRKRRKRKKAQSQNQEGITPLQEASPVVQPVPRTAEQFVGLNVGGMVYSTSRSTLVRYPNSLLGVLFTASVPMSKDNQGNYMIDGDGLMFRHVLNYLRRGALCLPADFKEHRLLQQEAVFYQLPGLLDLLSKIPHNNQAPTATKNVGNVSRVQPTEEKTSHFIEVQVLEEDHKPQWWRVYGGLSFLKEIPTLTEYIHQYNKGSQCLEFTTQHPMFPSNTYRKFPKTTFFHHICSLGYRLHTSDQMDSIDKGGNAVPWLRYLFTSAK